MSVVPPAVELLGFAIRGFLWVFLLPMLGRWWPSVYRPSCVKACFHSPGATVGAFGSMGILHLAVAPCVPSYTR